MAISRWAVGGIASCAILFISFFTVYSDMSMRIANLEARLSQANVPGLHTRSSSHSNSPRFAMDNLIESCDLYPQKLHDKIVEDLSNWGVLSPKTKDGKDLVDWDRCGQFVRIIDQRVYVGADRWNIQSRRESVLQILHDLVITHRVPDVEICLRLADADGGEPDFPVMAISKDRTVKTVILIPDFTFGIWPEARLKNYEWLFDNIVAEAEARPWDTRINKAFFRGAPTGSGRQEFADKSKDWPEFDFQTTNWFGAAPDKFTSNEDSCKYKYLIHMEGNNAYSSRIKYQMLCNSTVVFNSIEGVHPPMRQEFWYDLLEPNVNYVNTNFENAQDKMRWLMDNEDKAQEIARNGFELATKALSYKNILCYWQHLLFEYKKHMPWKPMLESRLTDHYTSLATGK
eukprot:TRINITY_DN3428_c0_g1_i1.p1 TRINITY_DN3428_c0_g1~~TRINITY_DN3428_c0_g1_i1.p1  ORF type:complete len:408 (-),score=88.55 TRINITY_DN3428_c0_g1_i1:20-1222(-)